MLDSMRLAGRGAAGLMAVAVVAGVAAGCSSPAASPAAAASSAASSAAPASSAAATTAASAAASAAAAPAVTSSAAAAPSRSPSAPATSAPASTAACPTRYLAAKAGLGQGAAGSDYQVIDFTNISSAPCTLYGYPGVSLAGGHPVTQIGAAASRSTATSAAVVTLAPGQTANALLRITHAQNYPSAACAPASTTYLQIYPPDQFTPIYLAYQSTGCAKAAVKLLTISVVAPGTGGG